MSRYCVSPKKLGFIISGLRLVTRQSFCIDAVPAPLDFPVDLGALFLQLGPVNKKYR